MPSLHALVRGRVQGVGFRWFVRERARELGVRGWVRNRGDGSVEVEAEGELATIERLRELLRKGPPGARVSVVEELAAPDDPADLPSPFAILR
ncbi:MAG: acylphosphatase [Gemmatimonadaceae bacterium]